MSTAVLVSDDGERTFDGVRTHDGKPVDRSKNWTKMEWKQGRAVPIKETTNAR